AAFTPPGTVYHIKAFENARDVAVRNALAVVTHANDGVAIASVNLDFHSTALRRMANGVVDEVDEDLREPVGIGFDLYGTQCQQLERDAFVGGLRFERSDDRMRDFFEIDLA